MTTRMHVRIPTKPVKGSLTPRCQFRSADTQKYIDALKLQIEHMHHALHALNVELLRCKNRSAYLESVLVRHGIEDIGWRNILYTYVFFNSQCWTSKAIQNKMSSAASTKTLPHFSNAAIKSLCTPMTNTPPRLKHYLSLIRKRRATNELSKPDSKRQK